MGILYAGLGIALVIWGFPYLKTSVFDTMNDLIASLFPSLNPILALLVTWASFIALGVLFAAVIFNLFFKKGSVDNG